jgi:hypothetical protein
MGKNYLLTAFFLVIFTVASAIPRLSAADPTPTAAPAVDNTALVAKVNGLYYNYKRLGLHKFKCEVKISMFDNLLEMLRSKAKADDPRYKAIKDVHFFMNYDEKDGLKFNYSNYKPTGDPKIDSGMAKVLDGTGKVVDGFWKSWKSMTFEPAIDSSKTIVTVNKTAGGYEIKETKDTVESTNILNEDLVITEVDGRKADKQENIVTIKPLFLKTADGLLLNSANVDIPKAMNEVLDIDYQDVQKYKLPSKSTIAIDMLGNMKTNVTLLFSTYQLN